MVTDSVQVDYKWFLSIIAGQPFRFKYTKVFSEDSKFPFIISNTIHCFALIGVIKNKEGIMVYVIKEANLYHFHLTN